MQFNNELTIENPVGFSVKKVLKNVDCENDLFDTRNFSYVLK